MIVGHGFRRRDAAHAPGARRLHDRADCRSFVRRDTHRPLGWSLPAARELYRRQGGVGRQRPAGLSALAHERDRHRMGAHVLARDAAGRVGGVEENERDKLHARVDVTTGALRPHACGVWSRHLWA